MIYLLAILFLVSFILLVIALIWFSGFIFGAPFEPSNNQALRKMIEFSKVKKGDKVAELGSGNGKIAIAFAKKGAIVHGFEINPFLVLLSRRKIRNLGLESRVKIYWKNFWKQDLSKFDIITVFQIGNFMPKLERKLKKELTKGTRIVSNTWKFPNWRPKKVENDVYLYEA